MAYGLANNGEAGPSDRRPRSAIGYDHGVPETETYYPKSDSAMRKVGATLVRQLEPGDVVLLYGDLGAGKTTLVRGALSELGYAEPVRSPTFNILQSFDTEPPVLHVDLYRVGSGDGLGIEDYMASHVCFVEWPDETADWLDPEQIWRIDIEFQGTGRKVTVRRPALR